MATPPPIAPTDPVVPDRPAETPPWQAPVEEPVPDDPSAPLPPPDRDFPDEAPREAPVPDF